MNEYRESVRLVQETLDLGSGVKQKHPRDEALRTARSEMSTLTPQVRVDISNLEDQLPAGEKGGNQLQHLRGGSVLG